MQQVTPLPLVSKGQYSLVSDMKLGWKPNADKKPKYLSEVPTVVAFRYPEDDLYVPFEAPSIIQIRRPVIPSTFPVKTTALRSSQIGIPPPIQSEEPLFKDSLTVYRGFRPRDSLELNETFKKNGY